MKIKNTKLKQMQKIGEIMKPEPVRKVEFFKCDSEGELFVKFKENICKIDCINIDGKVMISYSDRVKIEGFKKPLGGFQVDSEMTRKLREAQEEVREVKQKMEEKRQQEELEIELKKPLFFTKEKGSYFACDQSYHIEYMRSSRVLSDEEQKIFSGIIAIAKGIGKTETMPHTGYTGSLLSQGFSDNISLTTLEKELKSMPEYEKYLEKKKEKEEKIQEKQKKIQTENEFALKEARKTNKNVIIRKISCYDGDGDTFAEKKFGKECGIITIYEIATPEGKIIQEETAAY